MIETWCEKDEKNADANGLFDVLGSYSRASVPDIPTLCRTSADLSIRSVLCSKANVRGPAKSFYASHVRYDIQACKVPRNAEVA